MNRLALLGVALVLAGAAQCSWATQAGDQKQPPKVELKQLLKNLKSTDEYTKLDAMMQLADWGPQAAPAIPDLVAALQSTNEDFRLNSAIALGKIGKAAVAPLAELVADKDVDTRYYAIWALGWIGPDAKDMAPLVVKALADKNDGVRRKAAFALGRIAPGGKDVLPVLIKAFSDPNEDVRAAASEAVGKFGKEAVPALVETLREKKTPQSIQAARALGEMGSDAKDAIGALKDLLYAQGAWQSEAAEALAKIGKASIPTLVEATKDQQASTRLAAIEALAKVGAEAVPDLVDALGNKHADVRRAAAAHLEPMRVNDKMVVLGLAYALKDEDEEVRRHCAQGLQNLGLMAKLAAPKLKEALIDINFHVRIAAYYALAQMNEEPTGLLRKYMKDEKANVRIPAAALLIVTNGDNEAVPVLVDGLKEKDFALQMQSAFALAQRRQEVGKITPIFIDGLKSKSPGVREQSIQGLQMLGAGGEKAAPALLQIMQSYPVPHHKQQALQALQQVGGDPKVMVPALKKMLEDKDAGVRLSALQVVWRYGPDAIPLIVACFEDKDENIKQNAMWVLQSVQGATLGYGPVALPLNQDPNTADLIGTLPNDFGKVQVQNGFVQYFPGLQTQRAPLPNFGGDANLAGRFSNQVVVDRNGNIVLQNPQPDTTGNSSYRWFSGPGHMRFDAALSKRIQIAESKAFTIRADAINLLNRPIWGDPNTDINSASFGRITGYARGYFPRTITIGTRFDF